MIEIYFYQHWIMLTLFDLIDDSSSLYSTLKLLVKLLVELVSISVKARQRIKRLSIIWYYQKSIRQ